MSRRLARPGWYVLDTEKIIAYIDATRAAEGLSMRELEDKIGISDKPIRRLRNGQGIDALTLVRIMMHLGITNILAIIKEAPHENER